MTAKDAVVAVCGVTAVLLGTHPSAEAAFWRFQGDGAGGGVSYEFTVSNGSGESQQSGELKGGFNYEGGTEGGWLSNISAEISNVAFHEWGDANATQNDFGTANVRFTHGYISGASGNVQTLYLWNVYGSGNQAYARGVELTFNQFNLGDDNAILGVASTANDNFCKQIVSGSNGLPNQLAGLAPTGCTAAKNNLTNLNGILVTPSPAVGLGLLPMGLLAWRRKTQRQRERRVVAGLPATTIAGSTD